MQKIVIIGGVTGGATAAGRMRRLDDSAEIIMLERGNEISFANCGLPYYIGGEVENKERLLITTPEKFASTYNLKVRVNNEVTKIRTGVKEVTVTDHLAGSTYTEKYDKLLIATGAEPNEATFPGSDLEGVVKLRSYSDAVRIKEYIDSHKPKSAIIVGAGFISMEIAESFVNLGIDLTIVYRGEQLFSPLDSDMTTQLVEELKKHAIKLVPDSDVNKIEKTSGGLSVTTSKSEKIVGDMVFLAIGSHPESHLAKEAGLELSRNGSIVVNDFMQTSSSEIYAVGDVVEVTSLVTGGKINLALAGPTQQQARIAAHNMVKGNQLKYKGVIGSSVLKLMDINIASTGINSQQAEKAGIDFDSVTITSNSHASYYPGSEHFKFKVLYEKVTGRILGCQAAGGKGVDKRCDVIATAIYAGLSAWDLEALQLCYAPPYSIPRDAVNIVGGLIVAKLEN